MFDDRMTFVHRARPLRVQIKSVPFASMEPLR